MPSPLSIGEGILRRIRVRFFTWPDNQLVGMTLTLLV